MPRLDQSEVCRLIKPVDISTVITLSVLDKILPRFFTANVVRGSAANDPSKYQCDVVLESHFPPELKALVEGLELGGERARAVLRRLSPRQSIPPHVDAWMGEQANWRRFQVPLITDPRIIMTWPDDGVEVHLEAGNLYEVRFDRTHAVVNGADTDRIHLQVDQVDATI